MAFGSVASAESTDKKKAKGINSAAAGKANLTTHLILSERFASST